MGKKHSEELSVKVVDYPNMVYVARTASETRTGGRVSDRWVSGFLVLSNGPPSMLRSARPARQIGTVDFWNLFWGMPCSY